MHRRIYRLTALIPLLTISFFGCGQTDSPDTNKTGTRMPPSVVRTTGDTGPVKPLIQLDHEKLLAGRTHDLFLLVQFTVPEGKARTGQERMGLNVGMVIDRSGSMAERGKIEYARRAGGAVVDGMGPTDHLAIVEYDDRVTVLWPSAPVSSPSMIKRLIEGLEPRGSTDLCGGLRMGIETVAPRASTERLSRVMLLSDGLANTGITDPDAIARFAREARRAGVTVSTMGLGLSYNEDLMQAIAEQGGGTYSYIESPAQMEGIFRKEVRSLRTTVATNVRLAFHARTELDTIALYGYAARTSGDTVEAVMADLCAGEKRSVLIKMRIRTVSPGRTSPGSVTVTYHDCFTGRPGVFSADLFIEGTSDSAAADASAHPAVIAEAALIEADDEHERYVRQYEKGERARAEKNIDRLTSRIQDINATLNDVRLAKKIEALHMESREMDEGDRSAAARSRYLKSAKQKLYYAKKGKRGKYVMRQGDKSHDVIRLQKKLTELNHYAGPVDGHFTARLDQAVKDFQTAHGLEPDGIAGPRTLKELGLY